MEMQTTAAGPRKGISGSTVKMVAVIAMLIDHIGAGVLGRYLVQSWSTGGAAAVGVEDPLYIAYTVMRLIGRLGFPIFCFLLVEGFGHTRSVPKYALRLLAFCIISEIPFDLLFSGKVLEFGYQNVFFTLLIGLLVMWGFRYLEETENLNGVVKVLGYILLLGGGAALAQFLRTDYGATGVVCILVLYIFRKKKAFQILAGCIAFAWELTAPLAFIPVGLYNGTRGWNMKYFFYIFYPAHLLILWLICYGLGMGNIAVV